MYRLNITFVVEPRVQERWLGFMKDKFVPYLHEGGYGRTILSRVISVEAVTHFTYSLLVELDSMQSYADFTGEVWKQYAEFAEPLFGVEVLWFMTLMREIENC